MQQPNNSCSAATRCDVPSKYPPNHVQMDVHGAVSPIKSRITVAQPKYNIYDSNRTVTKEELEAMEEHANISTCTGDLSSIRKEYGRGIFVYFKYLWYLALVDLVLAVFSVILYVTAVSSNGGLDTRIYDGLDLLFLASFPHGVKGVWYAMSALGIFVAFMAAPLYKRYENRISSFWHGEDRLEEDYVEEEDVIEENRAYTSRQRSTRRIISVLAFAVICVVQGFVTYGLHELLSGSDNQITAQILAAAVAAMKMLWKFLSKYMTRFEKHRRKRDYYEWDTGKVFFMRMANVLGLYLTKYLSGEDNIDPAQCKNINFQNDCGCPLAAMGQQFFWLIIFEISAANLIEIAIPFLMLHWKRRKQLKSGHGDCGDGICNPYRQMEVADKYWAQRKRLFTKFDKGCKLDRDGWFSVTPEIIANHIAQKMFHGHHDDKAIVLDAFAGVGGNSIAFALRPEVSLVICVDIDESRLCFAANNCLVYDIPREKIVFILADAMDVLARYKSGALASCLQHLSTKESPVHRKRFSADYHGYRYGGVELLPEKLDAIFLSPPWGGMDYGKLGRQGYSLSCIHLGKEIDGDDILMAATQAACPDEKNIAYFLPRNLNGFSVGKSLYKAGFDVCWMEQNVVNMKLKTICVYTKLAMVP